MGIDFKINPKFAEEVMRSSEVRIAAESVGEDIAVEARKRSDWGDGSIAKGIRVDSGIERGILVVRVNAMDWKSHFFQFGTSKMKARPFLTDAAEALGFQIEASRG